MHRAGEDAVDAYERKLVKQIEVTSATVEDAYNRPYVRLVSTSNKRGVISANVELDVEVAGQVRRRVRTVQDGYDLEQETGRAVYRTTVSGRFASGREGHRLNSACRAASAFSAKAGLGEAWMSPQSIAR